MANGSRNQAVSQLASSLKVAFGCRLESAKQVVMLDLLSYYMIPTLRRIKAGS